MIRGALVAMAFLGLPSSASAGFPEVPAQLRVSAEQPLEWQLDLAAGDFIQLQLQQLDVDVVLVLEDAGGKELRRNDAIPAPHGHEDLWWVVDAEGRFVVRIQSEGSGEVVVKAASVRAADERDRQRSRAENLMAAGRGRTRENHEGKEEALASIRAARKIFSNLEIHDRVCFCLRLEGQQLRILGRLSEAKERLEECVAIAEAHELLGDLAAVWLDLSAVAHSSGDKAAGLSSAETSLEVARRSGIRRRIVEARSSLTLALARVGRRREALPLQREVVEDARRTDNVKDLAWGLVNLGANLYNLGDAARALEAFREARELLGELGLERERALVVNNIGAVLGTLGDFEAARAHDVRALAVRQELGDRAGQASSLINLGDAHRQLGMPEAAVSHYQRAIALYEAVEDRWGAGFARAQLGVVLVQLERADEAKDPLAKALATSRELRHHDTEADALEGLAEVALSSGDREQARQLYRQMITAALARSDPYREAAAHYGLARLAAEDGRRIEALEEIEHAVDLVESIRARAGGERLRAKFLHRFRDYYDLWLELLLRSGSGGAGATRSDKEAAYGVAERARARGLLDLLVETRSTARLRLDGDAIDPVLRLEEQVRSLQAESRNGEDLRDELESTLGELDLERRALRRKHPRYAEIFEPEPLDLAASQKLLDARTLLLEYHIGEERSWLFVVTQDSFDVHELPGEADLEGDIEAIRQLVSEPRRRTEGRFARAAGDLYSELIAPAGDRVAQHPRLLVVADGLLRMLPFEMLVPPGAGRSYHEMPYLVRTHEIAYVPSASVLGRLSELRSTKKDWDVDLLAYADPVPASSARLSEERSASLGSPELGRLQASAEEARGIAELFPRSRVYTAEDALEGRLKNDPDIGRARYLHFATHGLVNPAVPSQSALLLSRADDGEDGLLQAFEIVGLELDAELVTLSACETGLGRLYKGEGLLGLSRAFIYAGADRLLASLWRVADASTSELMTAFYENLREDPGNPAAALRQAKLQLIERPDRAHPYAWAPFVLLGG